MSMTTTLCEEFNIELMHVIDIINNISIEYSVNNYFEANKWISKNLSISGLDEKLYFTIYQYGQPIYAGRLEEFNDSSFILENQIINFINTQYKSNIISDDNYERAFNSLKLNKAIFN